MKALLLKDFYQTLKYCRSYLLIIAVFTLVPLFTDASFFSVYIFLIIGMLPVTLIAYDERSRWNEYCGALPYGKAQIVFSKYLIGVLAQAAAMILSLLINIALKGFEGFLAALLAYAFGFAASCVTVGLILPFIFGFGVEKGRIAYFILVGAVFGITFGITNIFGENEEAAPLEHITPDIIAAVFLGAIVLYVVSCLISVAIYKRHDVK